MDAAPPPPRGLADVTNLQLSQPEPTANPSREKLTHQSQPSSSTLARLPDPRK